ncbi:MAG TPA: alkaline phosphatase family protein [Polyangia bacterium]
MRASRRAILVSVDGLGAYYLQRQFDQGKLPNFAALGRAGTSTLNARTDYEYTITLPNHTSMLTGRPVSADDALPDTAYHGWTTNSDVDFSVTLHNAGNPNLSYVASVFDVVHDHGMSTCLYSGKTKFTLFSNSYNAENGAPDTTGDNDGRNKVDRVAIMDHRTDLVINTAVGDLAGGACDFAFIHIADTDWVGHAEGWGSEAWLSTLDTIDDWIGRIAKFADPRETSEPYALVVTADHGGIDYGHSDATLPIDYTIPFYILGPGLPPGTNLYALTGPRRADPRDTRPRYSAPLQPVRNADAANLITTLLGLPPVPGSFMHELLKSGQ